MNTNTGEIKEFFDLSEEIKESFGKSEDPEWVEVSNDDMTKKQIQNKKVSLHDNRSKLGRKFTEIRKSRKMQRTQKR
jgi:hypothetical protein